MFLLLFHRCKLRFGHELKDVKVYTPNKTDNDTNNASAIGNVREAAKLIHTTNAAISAMSRLKYTKPQPKTLDTQYDDGLKQLYLKEWPDAVRTYQSKQPCCCCRDQERDKDTRVFFKRVLPSYVFYFLVLTGAIPSGYNACDYLLSAWWHVISALQVLVAGLNIEVNLLSFLCIIDTNCQPANTDFEVTYMLGNLLSGVSLPIAMYLVTTYLRDQLRSRELQTLISSIGPGRIGRPRYYWWVGTSMVLWDWADCHCWFHLQNCCTINLSSNAYIQPTTLSRIGLFVFFAVLQIGLIIYFVFQASTGNFSYILSILFTAVAVAPSFTCLLYFFLVTHSISLCYDDWAAKMLSATAKYSLRDSVKVNLLLWTSCQNADSNLIISLHTQAHHFSSHSSPSFLFTLKPTLIPAFYTHSRSHGWLSSTCSPI